MHLPTVSRMEFYSINDNFKNELGKQTHKHLKENNFFFLKKTIVFRQTHIISDATIITRLTVIIQ